MKRLTFICLLAFICAFSACSETEKEKQVQNMMSENSALSEKQAEILVDYRKKQEEREKRSDELDKAFFEGQDKLINKYKRKIEERERRREEAERAKKDGE